MQKFEVKAVYRTDKGDMIAIAIHEVGHLLKRMEEKSYYLKKEDMDKSIGKMKTWYGVVDNKLETDEAVLEILANGYLWFRYHEDR